MKTLKIVLTIGIAASVMSCNLNNEPQPDLSSHIVGTYTGTLTSSLPPDVIAATAEITAVNNYNIQVHCYSADIDTTFFLGLYSDGSMTRVCNTGNDFMNRYGHNMSAKDQMICKCQMMGNMSTGTSWQQHLGTEHQSGDAHYGYFDMNTMTFDYTFEPTTRHSRHFTGKK